MSDYSPVTIDEALALLTSGDFTICAGATDIAPKLHSGRTEYGRLMDITHLPGLSGITESDGIITVGCLATFDDVAHSPLIRECVPLLAAAASSVGSQQVRNRATLVGNIANAAPAADSVPALTVLDTAVTLLSQSNKRVVPLTEFITGTGKTVLRNDELISCVTFPVPHRGCGQSYIKVGRRNALAISRISAASLIEISSGVVKSALLSIGASSPRPLLLNCSDMLIGKEPDASLAAECGKATAAELLSVTGHRPSFDYKLPVASDLIRDCILRAWEDCDE